MPRGKKSTDIVIQDSPSSAKKTTKDKWTFVEIPLTDEDKELLRTGWSPSMAMPEYLLVLVDYHWKLSFTFDDYNDCYIVTMTGQRTNKKNGGKSTSGRGGTLGQAWKALIYRFEKYFVDGNIPEVEQVTRSIDFD